MLNANEKEIEAYLQDCQLVHLVTTASRDKVFENAEFFIHL